MITPAAHSQQQIHGHINCTCTTTNTWSHQLHTVNNKYMVTSTAHVQQQTHDHTSCTQSTTNTVTPAAHNKQQRHGQPDCTVNNTMVTLAQHSQHGQRHQCGSDLLKMPDRILFQRTPPACMTPAFKYRKSMWLYLSSYTSMHAHTHTHTHTVGIICNVHGQHFLKYSFYNRFLLPCTCR